MSQRKGRGTAREIAVLAAVALGLVVRVSQLALDRSLYMDEAMLATGIGIQAWGDLHQPLLFDQVAPYLFLVLSKVAFQVSRGQEWALRLVPFLAGAGTLAILARLARRALPPPGALFVVLVIALAPGVVYYSQDFKPYAIDLLWGGLMPLLAWPLLRGAGSSRRWVAFVLAAGLAPFLGVSAIAAAVGSSLIVLVSAVLDRSSYRMWRGATVLCVTGVSAGVAYWLTYRGLPADGYMASFWDDAHLRVGSWEQLRISLRLILHAGWGTLAGVTWTSRVWPLHPTVGMAVAAALVGTGALLALAGWLRLRRGARSREAALLTSTCALLVVASLLGIYPISARLWLSAVVPSTVLAGAGAAGLSERLSSQAPMLVAAALAAIMTAFGLPDGGRWRTMDAQWSDAEAITATALLGGAPVYVYVRAVPQWLFYSTDWRAPDTTRIRRYHWLAKFGGVAFENAAQPRTPEPWEQRLLTSVDGGRVVVGLPSGVAFRSTHGWNRREPVEGWAHGEAERIDALPGDSVTLVVLHQLEGSMGFLRTELSRRGLKCVEVVSGYRGYAAVCGPDVEGRDE